MAAFMDINLKSTPLHAHGPVASMMKQRAASGFIPSSITPKQKKLLSKTNGIKCASSASAHHFAHLSMELRQPMSSMTQGHADLLLCKCTRYKKMNSLAGKFNGATSAFKVKI